MRAGHEYRHAREQGRRVVRRSFIANWTALKPDQRSKVGVIASRKLGPAVVRNRAKRLLREAFRVHQHALREPVALVLVARPAIVGKTSRAVAQEYSFWLKDARLAAEGPA